MERDLVYGPRAQRFTWHELWARGLTPDISTETDVEKRLWQEGRREEEEIAR